MIYDINNLIELLNTAKKNGQESVMIPYMVNGDYLREDFDYYSENFKVDDIEIAYNDFIEQYCEVLDVHNKVDYMYEFLSTNFTEIDTDEL